MLYAELRLQRHRFANWPIPISLVTAVTLQMMPRTRVPRSVSPVQQNQVHSQAGLPQWQATKVRCCAYLSGASVRWQMRCV